MTSEKPIDKSVNQLLIKSIFGTAGIGILNQGLTLLVAIVLARSLGPDDYGIYAFVISLVTLLGLPTKAGLPTLIVRETAKCQLTENWTALKGLLRLSNVFVIVFSALIALAILTYLLILYDKEQPRSVVSVMIIGIWLLPLIAFGNVRGATLRGFRRVILGQLPEQLIRPAILLILLIILPIFDVDLTPQLAMGFNVIAAFVAFIVGVYLLHKILPMELRAATPKYEVKIWIASLIPLSIFAAMRIVDTQLSTVILGTLASPGDVGLFRVAVQGASLIAFGLTSINMVLSPQVARLYHSRDMASLQRLITTFTRWSFLLALPLALILGIWGEMLIRLVFGERYVSAGLALSVLCVGQLFNVAAGSVAVLLNMAGFEKETLKGALVGLLCNIFLALLLVPTLGFLGSAIGSAMSLLVWNGLLMRSVYKKLGISTFVFSRR